MTTGVLIGRILFGLAFGIAGLYLLRVLALTFLQQRALRRDGIVTDGEVLRFETTSTTDAPVRGPYYAPVVRFKTADGAPIEFTSSQSVRPNPYAVGQQLRVRYLPSNPLGADVDGVASGWGRIVLIAFATIVCFIVASLPALLPPPTR